MMNNKIKSPILDGVVEEIKTYCDVNAKELEFIQERIEGYGWCAIMDSSVHEELEILYNAREAEIKTDKQ